MTGVNVKAGSAVTRTGSVNIPAIPRHTRANVPNEPVIDHLKPFAPDNRGAARRTLRVFAASGQIPHVEETQSGPTAGLDRPRQACVRCGLPVRHPVLGEKTRNMPRHVTAQFLGNKPGDSVQLFIRVVLAGDHQGRDLNPDPAPAVIANTCQDLLAAAPRQHAGKSRPKNLSGRYRR